MTPAQCMARIRQAFGNIWWIVAGYTTLRTTIHILNRHTERGLIAQTVADKLGDCDCGMSIPLDEMVAFTDLSGTDWYKKADGTWITADELFEGKNN